ncbi:MAG: T9SS type A sorting domain-containing protein [Bacteroidales bacterium]|nr:T9SS type A sorting domain-containing protein [Bacteroidales bacterium]
MNKNENLQIVTFRKTIVLLGLILIYGQIMFAGKISRPEHYKVIDGNPVDPVWSIYFEQGALNIGDEIGVYDGETLVGTGIVISDNILDNVIPVFSNLYKAGNKPILKVWNKNEKKEYLLSDYTFSNPYQDAWMNDVFPANDGEYSLLHFSTTGISSEIEMDHYISIYPNPSEGTFNISIKNLSGLIKKVQIKIFDIHGNNYRFFEVEGTKNIITEKLDLKDLAAGVYFISFSGKDFSQVKKIVIQ